MATTKEISRDDAMRSLREDGVADATISRAFGISKQRIGAILGPSGRDKRMSQPTLPDATLDDAILTDLPGFLKSWRKSHGLSQAGMATLLGVSLTAYVAWEGNRVGCSLPVLLIRYLNLLEKFEEK